MAYIKVGKEWLDDIYDQNVVKPNEFKQIVSNLVDKELSLRENSPPHSIITEKGIFGFLNKKSDQILNDESYYFNLSPESKNLLQAIIDIGYNFPDKLLISKEESQALIFAEGLRNKACIIRDCSDLLKSPYITEQYLYIDKKTMWAGEYLVKHAQTGRVLIAKLREGKI